MSQISKCPKVTVLLTYWEALGEVSEPSYKSLLYSTSVGSYCNERNTVKIMREMQWWPRWLALCCTAWAGVVVTSDRQPDPQEAFVQVPHFPIHHHHHHHHLQHHHDHHHQDHHHDHHDHRHHLKVTGRTVDHDADHYFMFGDMVYLVCMCGLTYSSPMWKSLNVLQVQKYSDIHNAAQRPFSGPHEETTLSCPA